VTPSVISYTELPFSYPRDFRPGPSIGLAGTHLSIDRNSIKGFHYQIITSNCSLHSSHSLFYLKMNCKAGAQPIYAETFYRYRNAWPEFQLTVQNIFHVLF